jgi:hypothetical protein
MLPMPGGYSADATPSEDAARLALAQRAAAEARLGARFARFEPVSASQQVVAGMNYRVKARSLVGTWHCARAPRLALTCVRQVRVGSGDADFVHLAIFQPLPHTGEQPEVRPASFLRCLASADRQPARGRSSRRCAAG